MKILITGAAGFIGSHLCEKFLEKDYSVIGIDFYDKNLLLLKKFNLSFLKEYKKFKFLKLDILNRKKVFELIEKEKPDFLIHCAAKAGVRKSLTDPLIYTETNVLGSQNLLEAIRLFSKTTRAILFSSSSVYGIQKNKSFSEDMAPNPQSVYGESKYAMELIAKQYFNFYRIPIIIVRPFSIYGPRGRLDMAPFLILKAAEKNEAFIKFGNNENNKRDWTHIDDLVEVIQRIIKINDFCDFRIVNIGNNTPLGIDDFVQLEKKMIKKYLNKNIKIINKPKKQEELPITYANIDKLNKLFDYKPKRNFKEGLENFFKYYIKNRNFYIKIFNKI